MKMYELYNNGKLDGIYTGEAISDRLNITMSLMYTSIKNATLIYGAFLVKKSSLTHDEAQIINRKIIKESERNKPCRTTMRKTHRNSAGRTFCLPEYDKEGRILNAKI